MDVGQFTFNKDIPMVDAKGRPQRHFNDAFDQVSGQAQTAVATGVTHSTGALTANDPVVGNGGGDIRTIAVLPPNVGGTGSTAVTTNGQIPIGNGTDYVAATLTAGAGITVTNASGAVTIAAQSGLLLTTVTFNNAAILTLPSNLPNLIAAPGAGLIIKPVMIVGILNATAGAYTNISSTGSFLTCFLNTPTLGTLGMDLFDDNTSNPPLPSPITTFTALFGAAKHQRFTLIEGEYQDYSADYGIVNYPLDISSLVNQPLGLQVSNAAGNFTGGNAANTLAFTILWIPVSAP